MFGSRLPTFACIFLLAFALTPSEGFSQRAQMSPLEFAQRADVGREINIQPGQLETVDRLQTICDAQCEARIMETLTSISTDLQQQFLELSPEDRQNTIQVLDREFRESIEMSVLLDGVFDPTQMNRFAQLRTQFLGIDGMLTERARFLMGFTEDQESQLREIQNIGADVLAQCELLTSEGISISQEGLANVQNILIDQSINILNGAQIEIFQGLCGEACQFDPDTPPAEGDEGPQDETGSDAPTETQVAGENSGAAGSDSRSGSSTRNRTPAPVEPTVTPPSAPQQQSQPNNNGGSGRRS